MINIARIAAVVELLPFLRVTDTLAGFTLADVLVLLIAGALH
jgi:hypothetical protein